MRCDISYEPDLIQSVSQFSRFSHSGSFGHMSALRLICINGRGNGHHSGLGNFQVFLQIFTFRALNEAQRFKKRGREKERGRELATVANLFAFHSTHKRVEGVAFGNKSITNNCHINNPSLISTPTYAYLGA